MLPQYFFINGYEIGDSQSGFLQYFDGTTWDDLGNWVADNTSIIIDSLHNAIPVPYKVQLRNTNGDLLYNLDGSPMYNLGGIFYAGGTWQFRLIDALGNLISNIITFTFPLDNQPLENVDNVGLTNLDGTPLNNL